MRVRLRIRKKSCNFVADLFWRSMRRKLVYAKYTKYSHHRACGPRQNNAGGQDAVHSAPVP